MDPSLSHMRQSPPLPPPPQILPPTPKKGIAVTPHRGKRVPSLSHPP